MNNFVAGGIEVRALVLGNQVDLTLLPRLPFVQGREIRFTRVATRVTIPSDTMITIAATATGIKIRQQLPF